MKSRPLVVAVNGQAYMYISSNDPIVMDNFIKIS